MSSAFTVYRGISRKEARDVLEEQRYFRKERVSFGNSKFGAHAVFGNGIYFIDNYEVAGQYAFCHAVHENDDCTVLSQRLTFKNPLMLDAHYTEANLRADVLRWRLGTDKVVEFTKGRNQIDVVLPESICKYVLHRGYDGIIYLLPNGSRYFICYFPEQQVRHIQIDYEFNLEEVLYKTFSEIRQLKHKNVR